MDKKIKISAAQIRIIAVLLVILGAISLMHMWIMQHASVEAPVSTEAIKSELASQVVESSSPVNIENNPAPASGIIPQITNPEIVKPDLVKPKGVVPEASVQVVPDVSAAQSSQGQTAQQEAQEAQVTQESGVISINAPMSDEQILAGIQQQDKKQQAIDKIVASRDAQAAQVMRHVAAAQSQPAEAQQTMPSSFQNPSVPADIKAKLKSHQLTAH